MIISKSQNRFRKGAKSASGAPGPKSAPRGSKSTTFAKGFVQLFNLKKTVIEVGFGNGENLVKQAKLNPDFFYLGSEVFVNGIINVLNEIKNNEIQIK